MSSGGFTFRIRTQFSFIVDDPILSHILSGIAKQNINITGYFQTKLFEPKNKCHNNFMSNIVRLVVGTADAESSSDLSGVRNVLDCLGVDFQEKSVIQIVEIVPGTPGIFSSILSSLLYKVTINALYNGEETKYFLDVSDICRAIKILSETSDDQCIVGN